MSLEKPDRTNNKNNPAKNHDPNPALYSKKYPMNKLNTATDALTVAGDTLTAEARSKHPGNHSEYSGKYSEYFAGCSEYSAGYSKNIRSGSYTPSINYSLLLKAIPEKPRKPVQFVTKDCYF
jgi:hypothetical protein